MSRLARPTGPVARLLVIVLTVSLAAFGLTLTGVWAPQVARADTTPGPGVPATVSADGLPTWQINGVVWSQVLVGSTVYVTGSFTKARPPGVAVGGAGEIDAANIFAFDITTGNPVGSFSHTLNAQGMAIAASPDGSRVFVGGDFTTVDGNVRGHLAAFNTTTGALVANLAPPIGGQVRALATTTTTVYAGGSYTAVGNSVRNRLSAFNYSTGALQPWAPSADSTVWALAMTPDQSRVIVGGSFTTLSGSPAIGMGSTDASTGAIMPWAANQIIKDSGINGAITTLRSDGAQVYGAGYSFNNGGNLEGTFAADPNTGTINWLNDCHGDTYDVLPMGQVLYSVSHAHDCSPIGAYPDTNPRVRWQHALASTTYATGTNTGPDSYGWNYNGIADSSLLQWFPDFTVGSYSGQSQAAWALAGNGSYVVAGGEFPTVNGVAQQGLVRFAVSTLAPNKRGPTYNTLPATPVPPTTAASFSAGTARIGFGTAWDKDNETLTYTLIRDGNLVPSISRALKSNFWTLPSSGLVDSGLAPGSTHTYQIKITDPFGNAQYSPLSNQVTISSTPQSAYAQDVISDGAASYWRLDESSGTAVRDSAGLADATAGSGVTWSQTGAITGDPDTASTFSGASRGTVGTDVAVPAPQSFTLEAWVKGTTSSGGQIIGFGSAKSGSSSSHDRQVYMDNTGHIWFAVNTGSVKSISSPGTYRNGAWHQVVASLNSTNGMTLYIDGNKITADAATTSAQVSTGYWRIGGDSLSGLPNQPSSGFLKATIDDVAIYPTALTLTQVQQHYVAAGGSLPNQNPTASFTSSAVNLVASFNGSGSTDLEGSIASYSWDFGDGSAAGTGVAPSHTYPATGTYQVTLTVTDNQSGTGSVTKAVTVTANQRPTASFTTSAVNLVASVDGSGSSDTDGTVASYSWNFGDGTAAGSGVSPSHAYAATGTYQVQLTVTDNQGATGALTKAVIVTAAGVVPKPDHVVVVVMENHSSSSIIGNSAAPYINSLATTGASMTQSFGVMHPSEPNYLALFSGSTQGLTDDSCPHTYATTNLADQLGAKSLSFTGYSEDLPSAGFTGCYGGNLYARKHSPWVNFPSVSASANQPLTTFPADYSTLPTVSFVIPNLQNDMHDGTIAQADSWLQNKLGAYVTWAQGHNSLLVLTWDESDNTANNQIPTIFSGERVKTGQYPQTVNHYNVLRTLQDAYGLASNDLSASATPITNIWGPPNQPPTAAFTSTQTDLSTAFDGSGSADPDGTLASYTWDFGDGTAGTGVTPSHSYATAGTRTVRLTVRDNQGATGTVTHQVTAKLPTGTQLVTDLFGRTLTTGWGSADMGGAWTGSNSLLSVGGGTGNMNVAAVGSSASVYAYLNSTATSDADLTLTMSSDKVGTGNGVYVFAEGRRVSGAGDYRLQVRLRADGLVGASILRTDAAGAQTVLTSEVTVAGYRFVAGDRLNVRFQIAGTSPTALRAKVWPASAAEPGTWLASTTDSTAGLQVAGTIGLVAFLSGSGTNAPVVASFDDLYVRTTL